MESEKRERKRLVVPFPPTPIPCCSCSSFPSILTQNWINRTKFSGMPYEKNWCNNSSNRFFLNWWRFDHSPPSPELITVNLPYPPIQKLPHPPIQNTQGIYLVIIARFHNELSPIWWIIKNSPNFLSPDCPVVEVELPIQAIINSAKISVCGKFFRF